MRAQFSKNEHGDLELTFESQINIDNGYMNVPQGVKVSTMTFMEDHNLIEWIINDGEFVETIGVFFEGKTLIDYDGVFELPKEAIKLMRKAGYRVPRDFED